MMKLKIATKMVCKKDKLKLMIW